MRVTRSMMVNNMSYWVSQQAEKLNDAETVVGSGKNINKPSDDPVAIGQILSDSVSISQYGQYELNITQASTWAQVNSTTLDTVTSTLQNASNAVSSYSTGGIDSATSVSTLTNYYDQILSLSNSPYNSSYMYSGNLSNTPPFANDVNITGGVPANIEFGLGGAASNVTIAISDSNGIVVRNITGAAGTVGNNAVTWDGKDDSGTLLPDGKYSFTVTALNGTASVAVYPTYRGDTGGKQVIIGANETVVLDNNGGNIFSSILSNLSQAITAINNGTSDISGIGDALQLNMTGLEAQQVDLSNATVQLDNSNTRLQQLTTTASNRMSDLEGGSTASVEEAAIKLQTQQTTYEEVISATGNILKMPKLTDYL